MKPNSNNTLWYVYMVRCNDQSLYTGVTTDLQRRLREHNAGGTVGAKYTRSRRPVRLVYREEHPTRSAACKREYEIKHFNTRKKAALLQPRNEDRLFPAIHWK